jgi:hypothetical protein
VRNQDLSLGLPSSVLSPLLFMLLGTRLSSWRKSARRLNEEGQEAGGADRLPRAQNLGH